MTDAGISLHDCSKFLTREVAAPVEHPVTVRADYCQVIQLGSSFLVQLTEGSAMVTLGETLSKITILLLKIEFTYLTAKATSSFQDIFFLQPHGGIFSLFPPVQRQNFSPFNKLRIWYGYRKARLQFVAHK